MPNIYAHYLTGEFVFNQLPSPQQAALKSHWPAFRIGLQGPDFLFYMALRPPRFPKRIYRMGSDLHSRRVGEFFSAAVRYLRTLEGEERASALAYVSGFLCHYALDTTAHPYIYYFVPDDRYHTLFETRLDCALMAHLGRDIRKEPVYRLIDADGEKGPIARFYSRVLPISHGVHLKEKEGVQALGFFCTLMKMTYDPKGKKYRRFRRLEKMFCHGVPLISRAVYPQAYQGVDYLNLSHTPWRSPALSDGPVHTESFLERMDQAVEKGTSYIDALFSAMECEDQVAPLLQLLGEKHFSTGEDWRLGEPRYHGQSMMGEKID